MTRAAILIAAIAVGIALSVKFALHLVYGWRPAPRVDRDAWPEGVGTW